MKLFRIQENVPDVYVNESRDFQLLCNLFDCVQGGVKFDIDSIRDITDTNLCNERVLNFLQTKLGFFTNIHMTSEQQRIILKAFPYLIKKKGSKTGIIQAIQVFLKTQGVTGDIKIEVTNKVKEKNNINELLKINNLYIVEIAISTKLLDISILKEILKYIIPAGYIVKYSFYSPADTTTTLSGSKDIINIVFVEKELNDGIKLSNTEYDPVINSVSNTSIIDNKLKGNITSVTSKNSKFTHNDNIGEYITEIKE